MTVSGLAIADHHEGSWTGEVVDLACYVAQGAKGADHAGCAKTCVKNGQPMGLLTDDGTLVLLAADHKNGDALRGAQGPGRREGRRDGHPGREGRHEGGHRHRRQGRRLSLASP